MTFDRTAYADEIAAMAEGLEALGLARALVASYDRGEPVDPVRLAEIAKQMDRGITAMIALGLGIGRVRCIAAPGALASSLTVGQTYHTIPDREALHRGYLRVLDDTGEDYLFDADWFEEVGGAGISLRPQPK